MNYSSESEIRVEGDWTAQTQWQDISFLSQHGDRLVYRARLRLPRYSVNKQLSLLTFYCVFGANKLAFFAKKMD